MCHLDAINPNSSIWMKQRYHSIQTMWRNLANMSGVNITRIMVFEYMKIGPIWFTTATILRRLLNLTPTSIQTGFFYNKIHYHTYLRAGIKLGVPGPYRFLLSICTAFLTADWVHNIHFHHFPWSSEGWSAHAYAIQKTTTLNHKNNNDDKHVCILSLKVMLVFYH